MHEPSREDSQRSGSILRHPVEGNDFLKEIGLECYTISCHRGIKKDIISLENVWERQQNFRFCRKRIRRTLLYLFLWESLKQEEREKGVKYQNQLLSGAYACNEICISCKAKEQSR